MNDAALALILGGSPDVASRTVAMYANKPKAALDELGTSGTGASATGRPRTSRRG